ncbi:protein of unknown function (AIG1 domain) [endosymbiont DhMRE of Dentiscutata heterogama]|uniref:GTPase n=1 Tax=endosymbiont DhMRE of Dentiscutata heterogama TaxID=1609546 RepID=UPI0006387A63|nr:GTPase [endosymbiont DhMRE of Dentiscutata heterogama]CFW92701.1 protein of unknown function (AIG1 domain) [endosymbiont DhMRE of Dentiscutata heterogama]
MVNVSAQQWLEEKYPTNGTCQRDNDLENKGKTRKGITLLDLRKGKVGNGIFSRNKNLTEDLKLEDFTNLRKLIISSHQLISLDVSDCPNLEELDCRGNELTNLNVTGCSNLKKIDCSNNPLRELDLSTCPKLEEVNINSCLNLSEGAIKSGLTYDVEKGKLAKGSIKNSPQIRKVVDNDVRNILIVGITGNGKSTLANALSNTEQFKEGGYSTSTTKNFQVSDIFEWKGKKYRVIDNVGFGDTSKLSERDNLFKIGEGIHSTKEGINQVLFIFQGRFTSEQSLAYKTFKDFISESQITKFTTLVRTNFSDFKIKEICQKDQQALFNENEKSGELKEIISFCNSIIHVDNPSTNISAADDEDEKEREERERKLNSNKKIRTESRERVLNYLVKNCLEIYKLKEWDDIYEMVEKYMGKKEKIKQSSSSTKEEDLKQVKDELVKKVDKSIRGSIGVSVPGTPVSVNISGEYITHMEMPTQK